MIRYRPEPIPVTRMTIASNEHGYLALPVVTLTRFRLLGLYPGQRLIDGEPMVERDIQLARGAAAKTL